MIDFRYHIVSLIAVFLALAVGIVLGAGPLRGSLGDTLAQQVEELRQEREEQRVQIGVLEDEAADLTAFVDAAATRLLPGALGDARIAVVEMPDSDGEVAQALLDRVEQAGGEVVARVALTASWTDPAAAASRDTVADDVAGQMLVPPSDDAPTAQVLGAGLGQALTQNDALSPDSFTSAAAGIYTTLVGAELLSETVAPTAPADAVLVVAPAAGDGESPDAAALEIEIASLIGMAGAEPVLAGVDDEPDDLVAGVRADAAAAEAVTTVDSADDAVGQVLAPLALAAAVGRETVAHYGVGAGATAVLPPPTEPAEGASEEATDGEEAS